MRPPTGHSHSSAPFFEQDFHQPWLAVKRRTYQRRRTVLVFGVDTGALSKQRLHPLDRRYSGSPETSRH
jgi:hypothetical protein